MEFNVGKKARVIPLNIHTHVGFFYTRRQITLVIGTVVKNKPPPPPSSSSRLTETNGKCLKVGLLFEQGA
jgi:hypothetical protein